MKTRNILNFVLAAAAFVAVGCTSDYLRRNTNQEQVTDEMLEYDGLRLGSSLNSMMANVIPSYQTIGDEEYGSANFQVAQGLNGNIFANYEGASNSGFAQNNVYNINPDGWSKAMFNDAYTRAIGSWVEMNEQREGNEIALALADVLKVAVLHRVTDVYGPIPYSELTTGSLTIKYDSQEEVYTQMFKELGDAIDLMLEAPSSAFNQYARYDRVFYGDISKWLQFANTLRLRLALRVAYVKPELYLEQATAAISSAAGFLTDDAKLYPGAGAWENPLYVIEYNFNDGDAKAGATIITYMNSYADPRISKYFTAGSDGNYYGVRMGATVSTDYPKSDLWSKILCTNNDPLLWMSGAESYFLLAEHYLRQGDETSARNFYQDGISRSFSLWNAGSASSYISNSTRTVGSYTDPVTASNSYATALSNVAVAWTSQSSFEGHLEQIITQKYIAMFPEGEEAWAEFRRTGYPKVIPTARNNSGGAINTNLQIRRLPYPTTEYQANNANVTAAVGILAGEALSGTLDNGGTRLWWDKNTRF